MFFGYCLKLKKRVFICAGHDLQLPTTLTYGAYKSLDEVVTSGFSYASASAGILLKTGRSLVSDKIMTK